jgi:hypothetical protein
MSDDSGDFELFKGPAAKEKDEKSDEKFREEMAKAQAALQNLQQEEGQARTYDQSLAAIIVQFLSQPQNTDLFLLISRVVALNLPSEFVIAVLSLIDKKAHQEVLRYLSEAKKAEGSSRHSSHAALVIRHEANFQTLPLEHKRIIESWVANMALVAGKGPHRILETLVIPGPDKRISPLVVQLSSFILRNYLAEHQLAVAYETLREFMERVFVELVSKLAKHVHEQKALPQNP